MKIWIPNIDLTRKRTQTEHEQLVEKLFSDPNFSSYQTLRSAMILNSTAQIHGTKIFIFGLPMDNVGTAEKIKLFDKFDYIEYIPITISGLETLSKFIEIPDYIKNRPKKARDNQHPGAVWHYKLYNFIWENVKDKLVLSDKNT